jgi:hypothetical protein
MIKKEENRTTPNVQIHICSYSKCLPMHKPLLLMVLNFIWNQLRSFKNTDSWAPSADSHLIGLGSILDTEKLKCSSVEFSTSQHLKYIKVA